MKSQIIIFEDFSKIHELNFSPQNPNYTVVLAMFFSMLWSSADALQLLPLLVLQSYIKYIVCIRPHCATSHRLHKTYVIPIFGQTINERSAITYNMNICLELEDMNVGLL